jgi:transcription termination factor Rho
MDSPPGIEQDVNGLLEIGREGAGRLFNPDRIAHPLDVSVPMPLIRAVGLRNGDLVEGRAEGRYLVTVTGVNGHGPSGLRDRPVFERLTAIHPDHALVLGPRPRSITGRLLDLIAPVGLGQRGLIVAPPKAGKTTLLAEIAQGLAANPDVVLIACLVGERPEEVTELRRAFEGLVLAADLDEPNVAHQRVAFLGVEYAKRLAEEGRHAVVLLDSLTRLARAYNLDARGGGRTLSGGMDATALQPVRQIFGAARAAEGGGSVTILATCLIDTGSRLDDLVYEEFKGTGNMEVHLDRKLAEQRLFPAVNIQRSGTRHEELLLAPQILQAVTRLRRKFARQSSEESLSDLLGALRDYPTNAEALLETIQDR